MIDRNWNRYLLDTSALRGISNKSLQLLSNKGTPLYTSPYSCWELLCHLDEEDFFGRRKGQLMKLRNVEILDDPHGLLEQSISYGYHGRIPDNEIIKAMLAALQAANSMQQFYASFIKDSKGNTRQVSGCVARMREILEHKENRFRQFVSNIIERLRSLSTNLNSVDEHHRLVLSLVEGEVVRQEAKWASDLGVRQRVVQGTYPYYAYIFYRSLFYMHEGKTKIEKNDFEDSQICKHLHLDTPFHLVTNDIALLETMQRVIILTQSITEVDVPKIPLQVSNLSTLRAIA